MAASIFGFWSAVRLRLANETEHAGFSAFPTFLVQSPCSPANTAPVANIPATTNAIILVIVQCETVAYAASFKIASRGGRIRPSPAASQLPPRDRDWAER